MDEPIIIARGITKAFGGHQVLRGATISCKPRERLCLLGRSGSGKTTLLRILAGLDRADTGEILVGRRDLKSYDRKAWPIAMAFQKPAIYPHMSVAENLAFPLQARGRPKVEVSARVEIVANLVGVDHLLLRGAGNLSGGEAQRVALGKSIAIAPSVLLLDEPLSSVDMAHKWELLRLLKRIHDAEATAMILVTHDATEGRYFADRIAVLVDGLCAEPFSSGADPLSCESLAALRALAQPPANELRLSLLHRLGSCAVYGAAESQIRLTLPTASPADAVVLLWLAHDGVVSIHERPTDHWVSIMRVEESRPVGWALGASMVEASCESRMFLALTDEVDRQHTDRRLWVRKDRMAVYDPLTFARTPSWTIADRIDSVDGPVV